MPSLTRAQKDRIIDIIRNDAEIRFKYFHEGKTCAIGGLARAAGLDMGEFEGAQNFRINNPTSAMMRGLNVILGEEYGLRDYNLQRIQEINDAFGNDYRTERQSALISYIESL